VWSFPAEWEELIWEAARAELPGSALELRTLLPAIVERTRRYTDERAALHRPLGARDAARDLAARALFFSVADAAKLHVPLAELAGRGLLPARALHLLDVGAGCGAMTLGALSSGVPVEAVVALDRDPAALAILRRVVSALPAPPRVETVAADVAGLPDARFDLVVAGTVLNELPPARRVPLVRDLLARLRPDGALVLVEPALRATARALHELRDALIAEGAATVFAPCTRRGPCPALLDARDWCHEDRPFRPPPRLADLARRTGLRTHGLKFAYLTLRLAGEPLVATGRRALRVVSGALDGKGTVDRIVCGDDGRARMRVLRRDREAAGVLGGADRGDVLVVDERGVTSRIRPASSRPPAASSPPAPSR
jgi:ribosomal protein RSM22 (predicted rRNA methylase)